MQDDAQERTEEATPKRQKESKEKGQVPRSKDLNTLMLLIFSCLSFIVFGNMIYKNAKELFINCFHPGALEITDIDFIINLFKHSSILGLTLVLPICILNFLASFIGPLFVGRWIFSFENVNFKFDRLNPISGLKKIFSIKAVMEVIKALLKFVLILLFALGLFVYFFDSIMHLSYMPVEVGTSEFAKIMQFVFFVLVMSLVIIAGIDVPFQLKEFEKQIKMTKHEVKEEAKETEGKPEVKSRILKMQKELSKRRMMHNVPDADVIITNPTHFSVAIKYDDKSMSAPILLAKGADNIAMKIRQVGEHHKIPIVEVPLLARAIFYNTEIDEEVPSQLYVACAQVLAYVYKLKMFKKGKMSKPKLPKDVKVPKDMVR